MAPESTRGPNIRELESLRITRSEAPPPRRRFLPFVLALMIIAIVGAAGYETYLHTLGRPLEVQTATATIIAAEQPRPLISGSGYVVTRDKYITVGTKILGQIVSEPIEEGRHVRKGDLLARIDDRDYQAQLRQALADRELAVANVELAQVKAQRARELFAQHVVSQDQLDVAENALAVAQANVRHSDAEIAYARFNVGQCVITSPINGVVLQKYREVGDTINYGGDIQAGGGTTDIVQLADTEDMRVEADISENDIAKVLMGMPATVVLDAYPDRNFEARVVKIYPEADRQKGTVKVEVRILKPDLAIVRPEMSAKIIFLAAPVAASSQPTVVIPKNTVIREGHTSYVWVVRDSVARRVPVLTGREFESGLEVKSGLDGGETVIVTPPESLIDGQPVSAKPS
ncbi:MAG TPA: efflux RND transporter periplasmic adaptor subunit [Candidatus Binataceae bacterium]|nr:efflux RND transporter periplasmic adaptor subunit [Candidatus Binataceae bacterium]